MKNKEVEKLYRQFGHRVYLRCIHLLREETLAMDMVQETFLSMMNHPVSFPDDNRALGWLLKVATNKVFNEFRRRRYWKTDPLQEFSGIGATNPMASIEDSLLFQKVLLSLKGDKASIIVSYFQEGRTLAETAEETGYSVPTVRRTIDAFLTKVEALSQRAESGRKR